MAKKKSLSFFDRFATKITRYSGSPKAFFMALVLIILWLLTGPVFQYSDTWQLIINTTTTIVTFLMVFVIQQSQNKDTMAIQLKLNELIAATKGASNRLIDIEDLSEEELIALKRFYIRLADLSQKETNLLTTHSIDEATDNHQDKVREKKKKTQVEIKNGN
jgi:low affinity Fe/Cu permease